MMRHEQRTFARNIRILLADRHMTQTELAREMGVTKETISNHLCGRRGISLPSLQRYADTLDVPMQTLLDPVGVQVVVKNETPAQRGPVRLRRAG